MGLLDLIVYVDAHPWIRGPIDIGSVSATGALALAPLLGKHDGRAREWWQRSWLFLALLVFSLFACRLPALLYPKYIGIDEAQSVAQAITFQSHPIPWRDVDGGTAGPLDSYALLWCVPFGFPPSYLTARTMGLFCILGMMIFLYLAGRRLTGEISARISLLPVFVFLCFATLGDYINYTTEQVSLFLIGWAIYLLVKLRRKPGSLRIIIPLGLVIGVLPFAKLQSLLPGAALGLVALMLIVFRRHLAIACALIRGGVLFLASIAPAALILSIVAYAGALNDFWKSYIVMASGYGQHFATFSDDIGHKIGLISAISDPALDMSMPVYLTTGLGVIVGACLIGGKLEASRVAREWYAVSIFLTLTMVATIVFTNMLNVHYHFFLLPALSLMTLASFRILRSSVRRNTSNQLNAIFRQAAISGLIAFVCLALFWLVYRTEVFNVDPPIASFSFTSIPLTVLVGAFALAAAIRLSTSGIRRQRGLILGSFITFFGAPLLLVGFLPNPLQGLIGSELTHWYCKMDLAILQLRPPGGRLAILGWNPEYAAETASPLGTRDAISQYVFNPGPLQDYYRQRYLHDMQTNRPELFLEASLPSDHGFIDQKVAILDAFPELKKLITENYRPITEMDGMRLFLRKDISPPNAAANQPQ